MLISRVLCNNGRFSRARKLEHHEKKARDFNNANEPYRIQNAINKVSDVLKFDTRCAPKRFEKMVSNFTEDQNEAIQEIRFGIVVKIRCGRLERTLWSKLVNCFNVKKNTTKINGKEI